MAVCYAIGFGVRFTPEECVKWLNIAAMGGSYPAQQALPRFAQAFNDELKDYVVPSINEMDDEPNRQSSSIDEYPAVNKHRAEGSDLVYRDGKFYLNHKIVDGKDTLLKAAENCRYDSIELLLANGVSGSASTNEGVTALHFLSSWDISKGKELGRLLVQAGANVNAIATRGTSVGGTPLMWSVFEDRLEHSSIILELGGNPTIDLFGLSALSLSARLHLSAHMRLLLKHIRPIQVEGWLYRLLVAAASGESRFSHILRHGNDWTTAPLEILRLLQGWNTVFPGDVEFNKVLLSALMESLNSSFGPSNTDIQLLFLNTCGIESDQCTLLLRETIIRDNQEMFDLLVERKVPETVRYDGGKTLLHYCAQNPNNTTTITYFADCLLELGRVDINAQDDDGRTPFMDALLARKWDLAHLLMRKGADLLATNSQGYNVLGLIIQTLNLGAAKWALKYSGVGDMFRQKSFIVHPEKNISAIQEAARLQLPRAHGMKTEVSGLFLFILANFMDRAKIDFRSSGLLPRASALDIAAVNGNVHAVKALAKKTAHRASGSSAVSLARAALATATDFLRKKNLERCIYIIENWDKNPREIEAVADGWTKLRTIDESHVRSSWEIIAWEWKLSS